MITYLLIFSPHKMNSRIKDYNNYYGDAKLAKWRELSARDKAANIIELWSVVSEDSTPKVVDIGCGDGAVIHELSRRAFGRSYVGFEVSESGVAYAQQRKYMKHVRYELFDGAQIPGREKNFDLAILSHVLEHAEMPRQLLREAARVATYVFVEVPLELNARTPQHYKQTPVGHINLYNSLLLRQLVESSGLRVRAEQITCPSLPSFTYNRPFWKGWLHWVVKTTLLRLSKRIASKLFTYHGCLLAESQPK